jgi:hypothetical protein
MLTTKFTRILFLLNYIESEKHGYRNRHRADQDSSHRQEQKEAQIAALESKVEELEAKQAHFETVAARLEALELQNPPLTLDPSFFCR